MAADRLVHVYAESVNVDFVQRVAKIANRLEMIDGVIDRLKEFNDGLLAERSTGHQNPG